jgi:prophage regulatory protein
MSRILRRRAVLDRTGLSPASLYRSIKNATFPRPYPLSDEGRSVGWLEEEIEAWIAARVASVNTTKSLNVDRRQLVSALA